MPDPTASLVPLTADDLLRLSRIGAIALSPDATQAVCTVSLPSLEDNRARSTLWRLPLDAGEGARRLTTCGSKDAAPAFSPDGRRIAFTAEREQEGSKDSSPQLYLLDADGGEARRVSRYGPGVGAFRWLPDGKRIVFVAWVWPQLKGARAQNERQAAWAGQKESGYITSEAQYRYWNANHPQGRVPHLHLLNVETGAVSDLMEGTPYELPRDEPGLAHFDVAPDGRALVFCHNPAAQKMGGQRCELVSLQLRGKVFERVAHHAQWDFYAPRYNPQGTQLAAIAARVERADVPFAHASFGRLALWPCSRAFKPADARPWHLDPQPPLQWESDGAALWLTAEDKGRCHAWRHEVGTGQFTQEVTGGWVQTLAVRGAGVEATVLTVRDTLLNPAQVFARQRGREWRLDHFNDKELKRVALGRVETHEVKGALGDVVQLWVVYPPGMSQAKGAEKSAAKGAAKSTGMSSTAKSSTVKSSTAESTAKRPAVHVIHGGPYTAVGDTFSYRWNPHVLAADGRVVVQTNYHGSSGFGEAFRKSILGRQGELELKDLKAAHAWILRQPWADASRVCAAGASYGGFLVAWMNGQWRPWPKGPIRAYVCHAGVFDRRATWSADSYSQRHKDLSATYWQDPQRLAAQSPVSFAAQMDTPTLVVHGALDYRVPDHNGLAYYNTLKARGIEASLLWYPDEGHWVQKPLNARQWYGQVTGWLRGHEGMAG